MPLPWKKQLADAHHEARQAKSRAYALETSFDARVAEERRKREAAEAEAKRLGDFAMEKGREAQELRVAEHQRRSHRALSDAELTAVAAVVFAEALPATPARAVLIDELTYRGVLPPKDP